MHYVGVDINHDYLQECDRLAGEIGFKQKVKRFELRDPNDFYNTTILIDYVFLINTLHEISPLYLDITLSDLLFKLKHQGEIIIHELRHLLSGEKDFITFDEEDILFLFEDREVSEWITCNFFPFKSKRDQIEMYNAYIVRTKAGFAPVQTFMDIEGQIFELLKRKRVRLLYEIENSKNKNSRSYAYLITLCANVSKALWDLQANRNMWAGEGVRCPRCGNILTVKVSGLDIDLDGCEATLSCSNCHLKRKFFRPRAGIAEAHKDYTMLKRYFPEEFEKIYNHPASEDSLAQVYEKTILNASLGISIRLKALSNLGNLRLEEDFLGEDATSSLEKIAGDASLEDEIRLEASKWLGSSKR